VGGKAWVESVRTLRLCSSRKGGTPCHPSKNKSAVPQIPSHLRQHVIGMIQQLTKSLQRVHDAAHRCPTSGCRQSALQHLSASCIAPPSCPAENLHPTLWQLIVNFLQQLHHSFLLPIVQDAAQHHQVPIRYVGRGAEKVGRRP
jgi:hypothetical protein